MFYVVSMLFYSYLYSNKLFYLLYNHNISILLFNQPAHFNNEGNQQLRDNGKCFGHVVIFLNAKKASLLECVGFFVMF